jgi:hypothetical protein
MSRPKSKRSLPKSKIGHHLRCHDAIKRGQPLAAPFFCALAPVSLLGRRCQVHPAAVDSAIG